MERNSKFRTILLALEWDRSHNTGVRVAVNVRGEVNEVFIPVTRHCLSPLRDSNRMVAVTNVINGEITVHFNDLTIGSDISVWFSNLRGVYLQTYYLNDAKEDEQPCFFFDVLLYVLIL